MINNIKKYLIVLFGIVIFSFSADNASASVFYAGSSNTGSVTTRAVNPNPVTNPTPTVINNYYYQTPTTTTKTDSTTANTKSKNETDLVNNLGASALNSLKTAPALSMNGSGGFLPSSVWQWILTVILILVIIIIGRMFVHKPDPANHTH